jgi:hypothetical protein
MINELFTAKIIKGVIKKERKSVRTKITAEVWA